MATRPKKTSRINPVRKEKRRFWLTIPQKLVRRPIIWEIGHKYQIGRAHV